jgi:hypothetical protein
MQLPNQALKSHGIQHPAHQIYNKCHGCPLHYVDDEYSFLGKLQVFKAVIWS